MFRSYLAEDDFADLAFFRCEAVAFFSMTLLPSPAGKNSGPRSDILESIEVHPKKVFGIGLILSSMIGQYRKRSILALVLMVAQSFLYNSVFFTFGLVLSHFYKVPSERIGLYLLPLAIGNFCGPLSLGPLFDTVGRKAMSCQRTLGPNSSHRLSPAVGSPIPRFELGGRSRSRGGGWRLSAKRKETNQNEYS
jgi:hypothetical protein